jgi:hypothetical protein
MTSVNSERERQGINRMTAFALCVLPLGDGSAREKKTKNEQKKKRA